MKKLLFIFLLLGMMPVFGMDRESEKLSEDVYCLEFQGRTCAIKEVAGRTSDGQETLLSAASLKKLNSTYISAALNWDLGHHDEFIQEMEKSPHGKVCLIKQALKIDLPNISSLSFNLIVKLLEAEDQNNFLKKLSEEEIAKVFIILDYLQADENLVRAVIRTDVNKKDARRAWKDYDGTEHLYQNYAHSVRLKEILKKELLTKVNCSSHFTLSQMSKNPITFEGSNSRISSVAIASDNSFIVTGSFGVTAKIWRLDEQQQLIGEPITLAAHDEIIFVTIASDNSFIVTGLWDGTAKIWRLDEQHQLIDEPITLVDEEGSIATVALASDNSFIVTSSYKGIAKIWRLDEQHQLTGEPSRLVHENGINAVALAPDNSFIVTGSYDGTAKIWRLDEEHQLIGEPIILAGHSHHIKSIVIAHDNSFIVTGSSDGTAKIWRLDGQHQLFGESNTLVHGKGFNGITSVVLASDNSFIITIGFWDKITKIWRLDEQHQLIGEPIILEGHSHHIKSIVIAHDNSFIVTGSYDETAKIWRLNEEHELVGEPITLRGHTDYVRSVTIANDNSFIVTGSSDGTVKIWRRLEGLNTVDLELPQILLLLKLTTSSCRIDLKKESAGIQAIYESFPENIKRTFDKYNDTLPTKFWKTIKKRPQVFIPIAISIGIWAYKFMKS